MTNGEKERLFKDIGYIKAKIESIDELWTLARKNQNDITKIKSSSRRGGSIAGGVVAGFVLGIWEIIKSLVRGN